MQKKSGTLGLSVNDVKKKPRGTGRLSLASIAADLHISRLNALNKVVDNGNDPNDRYIACLEKHYQKDSRNIQSIIFCSQQSLFQRIWSRSLLGGQTAILANSTGKDNMSRLADDYKRATLSRSAHAELFDVAFMQESGTPNELFRPLAISTVWAVQIKLLNVTQPSVWRLLEYDEGSACEWWEKQKDAVSFPETMEWSEMKALSKAVVFLRDDLQPSLDKRNSDTEKDNSEYLMIKWVKPAFKRLKVFMLGMIHMLCSYPEYASELSDLFGHAIPVVFLASKLTEKLRSCVTTPLNLLEKRFDRLFRSLNDLINILLRKIKDLDMRACEEQTIEAASLFGDEALGNLVADHKNRRSPGEEAINFCLEAGLVNDKQETEEFLSELNHMESEQPVEAFTRHSLGVTIQNHNAFGILGLKEIRVSNTRGQLLGAGTFSLVYQHASPDGTSLFAVKEPVVQRDEEATWNEDLFVRQRVGREAQIWMSLTHRNIHPLKGFCLLQDMRFPALVMDVCRMNLKEFVTSCTEVSEKRRLELLHDVAEGLVYMHSKGVAHGDLRANNVLVKSDENKNEFYAALCDFGISYSFAENMPGSSQFQATAGQVGSPGWLAPELLEKAARCRDGSLSNERSACVSSAGDMYTFGCVILEVLSNRNPYHDEPQSLICARKREGILPATREQSSDCYFPFLSALWEDDPNKRPTAKEASQRISEYINALD